MTGPGMVCGECQQRKAPDGFYASNQATCRDCVKARSAARRRANREEHRKASRRWRNRERLRQQLLEHVLRIMAAHDQRAFALAVMDAEDALGLEAGAAEDLFLRRQRTT